MNDESGPQNVFEALIGCVAGILGLATGLGITALVIWLCWQTFT